MLASSCNRRAANMLGGDSRRAACALVQGIFASSLSGASKLKSKSSIPTILSDSLHPAEHVHPAMSPGRLQRVSHAVSISQTPLSTQTSIPSSSSTICTKAYGANRLVGWASGKADPDPTASRYFSLGAPAKLRIRSCQDIQPGSLLWGILTRTVKQTRYSYAVLQIAWMAEHGLLSSHVVYLPVQGNTAERFPCGMF